MLPALRQPPPLPPMLLPGASPACPRTDAPAETDESPFYAGGFFVADLLLAERYRQRERERQARDDARFAAFPMSLLAARREADGADLDLEEAA